MTLFLILLGASVASITGVSAYLIRKKAKAGPLPHPAGAPVGWSKRHLPLLVITDDPNSTVNNMISRCCDSWNKSISDAGINIGGRMFVFSGYTEDIEPFNKPSPGVVPIKMIRDAIEHPHTQLTVNSTTHEIHASPILLSIDYSDTKLKQVIMHELGHVIGLPHSSDISSIMYPTAIATSTKVTAADIEWLRRVYG